MDEIQRFFMNHVLCHTGSRIHKISSIFSNVIGDGAGGEEGSSIGVGGTRPFSIWWFH